MSFTLVGVLSSGIQSARRVGVVLRVGGSPSRILTTTNAGWKRIRPFLFYVERIVVSLKALLRKPLKALRNSTFENVSSTCWTALYIASECQCFSGWKTHTSSGWRRCVVLRGMRTALILWSLNGTIHQEKTPCALLFFCRVLLKMLDPL